MVQAPSNAVSFSGTIKWGSRSIKGIPLAKAASLLGVFHLCWSFHRLYFHSRLIHLFSSLIQSAIHLVVWFFTAAFGVFSCSLRDLPAVSGGNFILWPGIEPGPLNWEHLGRGSGEVKWKGLQSGKTSPREWPSFGSGSVNLFSFTGGQGQIFSLRTEQRHFSLPTGEGQSPLKQTLRYDHDNKSKEKQVKETVPT